MRFHITRHQCLCLYVSRPPFHLFLGELRSAGAGFGGCAHRLVSFNNSTTNFRFTPDDSELYSVMSKQRDEIFLRIVRSYTVGNRNTKGRCEDGGRTCTKAYGV